VPLIIEGEAANTEVITYPVWAYRAPVILASGTLEAAIEEDPVAEFLVAHGWQGGLPLAATDSAKAPLRLAHSDETLTYEAVMPDDHADALQAWQKVDAGLMAKASLGYYLVDGEWITRDNVEVFYATRITIEPGDVSIVRYGGDRTTTSETRTEATWPTETALARPTRGGIVHPGASRLARSGR